MAGHGAKLVVANKAPANHHSAPTLTVEDPFPMLMAEVNDTLAKATSLFERWKQLLESENTATNAEYKWTYDELVESLKALQDYSQIVDESIEVIEGENVSRFKIERVELEKRKNFGREMKNKLAAFRAALSDPKTLAKLERDQRQAIVAKEQDPRVTGRQRLAEAIQKDNQSFIDSEGAKQQALLQNQEQDLTQLSQGIQTLRVIGNEIGNELDDQTRMMSDLDDRVDRTSANLRKASKMVNKLLKDKSTTKQLILIVFLIIVLVVLFIFLMQ
jgi:t-SNARE complex subunit (syntaxin)